VVFEIIKIQSIGDMKMTNDLYGIRSDKMNGRGGPLTLCVMHHGDLLSGYISPKLHRGLRRVDRFKKRKMRYE